MRTSWSGPRLQLCITYMKHVLWNIGEVSAGEASGVVGQARQTDKVAAGGAREREREKEKGDIESESECVREWGKKWVKVKEGLGLSLSEPHIVKIEKDRGSGSGHITISIAVHMRAIAKALSPLLHRKSSTTIFIRLFWAKDEFSSGRVALLPSVLLPYTGSIHRYLSLPASYKRWVPGNRWLLMSILDALSPFKFILEQINLFVRSDESFLDTL